MSLFTTQYKQFLAHVLLLCRVSLPCPSAGARPRQPQRGGNVTASVPQVSLTPARAKARSRLPQCRVPQPHVWERRGPGAAASAAGGAGTAAAARSHDWGGGGRASWRLAGAARRAPPGGAPGRSGPSPPQPQPAEALLSLLPVSPALARSLAPFSLRFRLKGGREKKLGRHFPSAAATAATVRRAGGRTEHRSEADSSRRGGAGGGRSALPGREEASGGGGRGAGSGCRRRRLFVRGGGAASPFAPARQSSRPGCGPRPCPGPAGAEEGRRKGPKEKKKRPLPAAAFPSPSASPPRPESQGGSGRRGGGERRAPAGAAAARPRPPPALGAQAGGCLQTAPILWGWIRPGNALPSRGRCWCCCSSPPPPPAALSPSPRSPCGSHFSLSLLVVTGKAGQGRKNPRNFKWPLRASPLRVRGWESPQGRGCAGALPHQLPPRSPAFPLAFYLKMRP